MVVSAALYIFRNGAYTLCAPTCRSGMYRIETWKGDPDDIYFNGTAMADYKLGLGDFRKYRETSAQIYYNPIYIRIDIGLGEGDFLEKVRN